MTHTPASILVVDDELSNFEVIEILLHQSPYQLQYAANGCAALTQLETDRPDLILLDVMMPNLDGIEVCRRIKQQAALRHIPIIMVTALNSKESLAQCLEAGADDFIGKPVNGLELRARVRSMLRIKKQYDALGEVLKLREDMSNMIVHDLRNPLTNITLACRVLHLYGLTEKQQQKLDQIEYSGRRLEEMINSLLMMAKIDAGKLILNLEPVNVCGIAENAITDLQAIAQQQQVNLNWNASETNGRILADASILRRVLDNLLSNALKFAPPNTQVFLKIDAPAGHQIRIQIYDQGRGISDEMQRRLFEKFETGESFRAISQTGLGLAFCKLAIEAHQGKIAVAANKPKGSVFTIEL